MRNPTAAAIVLEAFAAVEQRDEQRFQALCHPDAGFQWPPSLVAARPEHRWEVIWDPLQPTETECRMSPRLIAASDREVVVLWHQRGLAPDGERLDTEVLGLYEVRDGKFFRAQMFYFDTPAVLRFWDAAARAGG